MRQTDETAATDVLVVGAGISGLTCARRLLAAGRRPLVLDKGRGVGGRCATRRVQGRPVDHGLAFFHGSDPDFLRDLERSSPATLLDGWPRRILGSGRPCQSRAFDRTERRLAFSQGVTAFPKSLADGLDVRLDTRVLTLVEKGSSVVAETGDGSRFTGKDAVIALPLPQGRNLLETLGAEPPELRSVRELLGMMGDVCCLTLLAGYPPGTPAPAWDAFYPEDSAVLQMVSHDSAKRGDDGPLVLVYQALPAWSRRHLEASEDRWREELLDEAARLLGSWTRQTEWAQCHRWRHARTDGGGEMARPMLLRLSRGARLGLAGEAFAPGGGVQAAWRSGQDLARRLLEES